MYKVHKLTLITLLHVSFSFSEFKLGIEQLSPTIAQKHHLDTLRIGLVTNQTGVDQKGTPTVTLLLNKNVNVTTLFAPEHGYTGTIPAGASVENDKDPQTQLPIVSLYTHQKGLVGRTTNEDKIKDIDVLIFDMQDSGMRHYTYISTLMNCLQAAATYNKPLFILDRPNPLGGIMEGPLVEDDLISFISIAPIPLRHGMTIGELAWYFNKHILTQPAPLHVIRMSDYNRSTCSNQMNFKSLSPNIPTRHACLGYSFLGLLGEVRPFDVGVGTKNSFQCILLPTSLQIPSIVWYKAQRMLKDCGIKSTRYTTYNERKKEKLEGLTLIISDMSTINSFPLFLKLVRLFKSYGVEVTYAPTFDKAIGSKKIKQALGNPTTLPAVCTECATALRQFHTKARSSFLYKPYPNIV